MKVSFGSKSGVQFDDKDPGQKILHDERIRANTLLKEVIEGRIKRDAARQSYIFERNGWQKRLDEIPTGVVEGIGLFYYLAQVEFFNGLIEILDGLDLSHLDTKTNASEAEPPEKTKEAALNILVSKQLIELNTRLKDKIIYFKKKKATARKVYEVLMKIYNDDEFCDLIIRQNITGIESAYNMHRSRNGLTNPNIR